MKQISVLISIVFIVLLLACEKDEGKLPDINFKTGGIYLSSDATLPGGTAITIGINAAKTEEKDVLKKFNISESVNASNPISVYDEDLAGSQGDNYSYDYSTTLDTVSGEMQKFIFTVTNRDGLVNQVSLVVTIE